MFNNHAKSFIAVGGASDFCHVLPFITYFIGRLIVSLEKKIYVIFENLVFIIELILN